MHLTASQRESVRLNCDVEAFEVRVEVLTTELSV